MTEQYQCQSYVGMSGLVLNCTCGKCTTTERYTKTIQCPTCDSTATLYIYGHEYAGIYDCDHCGSQSCPHTETHTEDVSSVYMDAYGFVHDRIADVQVCDDCGVETKVEVYSYEN